MDEKRYELVEIQVDAELLEQLEAVIAPMGLRRSRYSGVGHLLASEMESRTGSGGGESGRGTLMLSKETFCEALRKIQAQKDRDEQFSKALTLMGDGHFVFEGGAPLLAALLDVLKEAVNDQYDYISWWLYDATPDYEVWTDA